MMNEHLYRVTGGWVQPGRIPSSKVVFFFLLSYLFTGTSIDMVSTDRCLLRLTSAQQGWRTFDAVSFILSVSLICFESLNQLEPFDKPL